MGRIIDRTDRIWTGLCLTCFPPVLHETGRASDRVHERLADNQVHDLGEGDVQLLCDWPEPAGHRRRWGGPQLGDTGDEAGSHRKVNLEGGGERFQLGTDLRGERGDRGRCNVNLKGGRRARRAWRAPVTHSVGRERGDSGVAGNRVLGCRGRDEAIPCSVAPLCGLVSESVAPVCFGITGRRCLVMSLRHNRTFKPPFGCDRSGSGNGLVFRGPLPATLVASLCRQSVKAKLRLVLETVRTLGNWRCQAQCKACRHLLVEACLLEWEIR